MNIIAICGYKRSGKDTIANYISKKYNFEHVKISQPLKDICKVLFNFSDDQLENNTKDDIDTNWDITPRQALQFIGTEVMQYKIQELLPNTDRLFWINALLKKYKDKRNIVISDLRFLHEYNALMNSTTISKVCIIKVTQLHNVHSTYDDVHISENEWLNIPEHIKIYNDGTLDELYKSIDNHEKLITRTP